MTDDDNGGSDPPWRVDGEEVLGRESPVRGQITQLLGEKRYEEALDLLYATRWQAPDSAEISRSINLLKERLIRHYLEELGNLDAVPRAAAGLDRASLSIGEEERALLHLVDGISSFSDIAHQSRLGRFETYRGLSRFVREGVVVVLPPPAATTLVPAPRHTTLSFAGAPLDAPPAPAPAARRWRMLQVTVGTLAVAGVIAAVWWGFDRLDQPSQQGAAVAGAPTTPPPEERREPPVAEPVAPAAPTPDPPPGQRELAAAAPPVELAPPDSEATDGARPSRRSRKLAGRSSSRSAAPPSAAPVPAALAAPGAVALPAVDDSGPPSLPVLNVAAAPAPSAPATATGSTIAPDRARSAQPGPAPPAAKVPAGPAKAAAAPFTPAAVSVVTNDVVVRGSLGRSVVEHAIARVEGDFRACYATAAANLRRNAAGTARVQLTIDETGNAGAVSVKGGPLPGVDACLLEAARRIRTRVPPDVGPATVTFGVVFSLGSAAR